MLTTLFQQISTMALLMAIGYVLYKSKRLSDGTLKELGHLLVGVIIPIVIIKSFLTEYTDEKLALFGWAFLLSVVGFVIAILVSRFLFKDRPVENFASAFCNAGFIGLPLVQNVLGQEAVFMIVSVILLLNLFQWTIGVKTLTGKPMQLDIRTLSKNPIIIASVLGFALFMIRIPVPTILFNTMTLMAHLNTPLAMIICGTYLAKTDFRKIFLTPSHYQVSFVRLILIPGLTLLMLMVMPVPTLLKTALLIAFSTPTGTNLAIFANLYQSDTAKSVELICNTTVLSVLTIPIWITLIAYL